MAKIAMTTIVSLILNPLLWVFFVLHFLYPRIIVFEPAPNVQLSNGSELVRGHIYNVMVEMQVTYLDKKDTPAHRNVPALFTTNSGAYPLPSPPVPFWAWGCFHNTDPPEFGTSSFTIFTTSMRPRMERASGVDGFADVDVFFINRLSETNTRS